MIDKPFPAFGNTKKTKERHVSGWKYVGWISKDTTLTKETDGVDFDQLVEGAKQYNAGSREVDLYAEGAICWWLPAS